MNKYIYFLFIILILSTKSFADKIEKFEVNGNQRISDQTVILFSKAEMNQEFNQNDFNEILKNLYETNFFKEVSIKFENNILFINLVENPIIQSIQITGIKSSKKTDPLYELMSMKEKNSFVENYISKDLNKIKSFLKVQGYYFSKVEVSLKENNNNTVDLIYNINLGDKALIKKINFTGNKIFKDKQLKNIIVSEEGKFWKFLSSKKYLNESTVSLDTRLLKSYYLNKGYYQAVIDSSSASFMEDGFKLVFNIDSGNKFFFNELKLIIPSDYNKDNFKSIYDELNSLKNEAYSSNKVKSILDKIDSLALSKQYEFINASINEKIVGSNKLNFTITVDESKKYYVNRISIYGNDITEETVIRDLLIVDEGDPFNELLNNKSINNINASGLFSKVDYEVIDDDTQNQKNINITVVEQPTGEVSAGAGVGTSGSTFTFGIKENNFNGKGTRLKTSITIKEDAVSGGINLTVPNYKYTDRSLSTDLSITETDQLTASGYKSTLSNISVGTSFEQRKDLYFSPTLALQFENLETSSTASSELKKQEGDHYDINLNYNLYLDKRNQSFDTTDGYSSSFSQGIPLLSDNYTLSNQYRLNKYNQITDEMITSIKFFVSTINSFSDNKDVRISDRLTIPSKRLRGFESGKVGPVSNGNYIGGNYASGLSMATSLPDFLPQLQIVDFNLFADIANLWGVDYNSSLDNQSNKIKSSVGISIDVSTPVGPLNFVFSQPITKSSTDKTETFRFDLGTTF